MSDRLIAAVADLDEPGALGTARAELAAGTDALAVIEACRAGMALVGERFGRGEYFVSDLIMAAAIFAGVTRLGEPLLSAGPRPTRGTVVMGTVKGDLHDIGKNLVVLLLRAAGYEVRDLGVNVPPQRFVDALAETGATVLGLSALLTTSFGAMERLGDLDGINAVPAGRITPALSRMWLSRVAVPGRDLPPRSLRSLNVEAAPVGGRRSLLVGDAQCRVGL